MTGLVLLGICVLCILIYGIYRVREELGRRDYPLLCILVRNQEDYIEGMMRDVVSYIRGRDLPYSLLVLVDSSGDRTLEIIERMSRKMSFIVREIKSPGEWKDFIENMGVFTRESWD